MCQEKQKPYALSAIVKLSAAASNQVRTQTKIDGNPACGVLALRSEMWTEKKKKKDESMPKKKHNTIRRTVSKEKLY